MGLMRKGGKLLIRVGGIGSGAECCCCICEPLLNGLCDGGGYVEVCTTVPGCAGDDPEYGPACWQLYCTNIGGVTPRYFYRWTDVVSVGACGSLEFDLVAECIDGIYRFTLTTTLSCNPDCDGDAEAEPPVVTTETAWMGANCTLPTFGGKLVWTMPP